MRVDAPVEQDGGQERIERHVAVGHAGERRQDERGRTHDRGHQDAAGRRHGFNRSRHVRRITAALHDRNRERSGDGDVRRAAAHYRPEQAAGNDCRLGDAAGAASDEASRQLEQERAHAARLNDGTEDHEQQHIGGVDAGDRAVDSVKAKNLADDPVQPVATMAASARIGSDQPSTRRQTSILRTTAIRPAATSCVRNSPARCT
jgi:hypothetical protein